MLTQTPEVRRMAPLEVSITEDEIDLGEDMLSDGHRASGSEGPRAGYNFEPEAGTLLAALLPEVHQHAHLRVAAGRRSLRVGRSSYRHEGRDGQRPRNW